MMKKSKKKSKKKHLKNNEPLKDKRGDDESFVSIGDFSLASKSRSVEELIVLSRRLLKDNVFKNYLSGFSQKKQMLSGSYLS